MSRLLDVLIVGGGAYYLASKTMQEEDDGFNRLLIGTAVGVPAALKGPELYNHMKDYFSNDLSEVDSDRITSSIIMGTMGYALGDKFGYAVRNQINNQNDKKDDS